MFSRIRCAVSAKNSRIRRSFRAFKGKCIPREMRLTQRLVHAWRVSSVVVGDEEYKGEGVPSAGSVSKQ